MNVIQNSSIHLKYVRGPQKLETEHYRVEKSTDGATQMHDIIFNNETFTKTSGFYKDTTGKYLKKDAVIFVVSWNGIKQEKISKVVIDLSSYIGKGYVKDKVQMTGNVYFLEFEVTVDHSPIGPGGDTRLTNALEMKTYESDSSDDD